MIVVQKKIRYLIISLLCIYTALYIVISKFKVIGIEDLTIVMGVLIFLYIAGIILSYIFFNKDLPIKWLIYEMIGFALISFFIASVFVLKIQDIFFWNSQKEHYNTFFKFSFEILGWNYILAIPYLIVLIIECSSLLNSRKPQKPT